MATLYRTRRVQLDVSPNQIVLATAPQTIALVGYRIYNPNTSDCFVGLDDATSGSVIVGTTPTSFGRLLVPASSEVVERSGTQSDPLFNFNTAISAFAATTQTGNTSPTSQLTIELFYYK